MKTHARFFFSQRFGKSTVTLDASDSNTGTVTITLPSPDTQTVAFTFHPQRAAQMMGDAAPDPEAIMRIAIGQAHKLFVLQGGRKLFGATLQLAVGTAPWIGDLTEIPYGGATSGYAAMDEAQCPAP